MLREKRCSVVCLGALAALLAFGLTGCTTTSQARRPERPEPTESRTAVARHTPRPAPSRTATDLLRAAGDAFKKANEAQEEGDEQGAIRHYNTMLELLVEAKLDPAVYYDLRKEFERILQHTAEQTGAPAPAEGLAERLAAELAQRPVGGDLDIPFPLPEPVLREIEEIQRLYPRNFQGGLDRHFLYIEHIRREFALAGLPEDLVWLAMVESQFHPRVVSPAGAAGMWQFMPATGARFNLRIDSYVDERFDWRKSTRAATAYLTDLSNRFNGDWALAVSSYNMGEGGMERAIAANGGVRDIWHLINRPQLKQETRKFYPKLLASVIVAKNPEQYGFKLNPQPAEECEYVRVNGSYSLASLDKASGLSEGTLRRLNPHFIREVTPPTGEHDLAVPRGARSSVETALRNTPKMRADRHVVRAGETPSGIARRYRVTVRDLMEVNNIRSARSMPVGKSLIIPGSMSPGEAPPAAAPAQPAAAPSASRSDQSGAAKPETYRVRTGDSLSAIATRHGVSVSDLQAWNELGRRTRIHAGSTLVVSKPGRPSPVAASAPEPAPESSAPAPAPVAEAAPEAAPEAAVATPIPVDMTHVVKSGESPARIAKAHNVPLADFLKWNNLNEKSMIRVGDKLVVRGGAKTNGAAAAQSAAPVEEARPAEPRQKTYKVASGDTASVIAQRHGVKTSDLLAWNNLTSKSVLRVGQELVIREGAAAPAAKKDAEAAAEQPKGEKITHTVAQGQNPTTIAKRYGVSLKDLYTWNNWTKDPVLRVGDKITIYKK